MKERDSRWDRYLGMTAAMTQVPVPTAIAAMLDKATTAVINAKLSLESSIRQTQREEGVLGAAVNTINPVRRLFLSEGSRRTGLMVMSGFRRQ